MPLATAPIVKTSVFEGPLDLLLSLIEERKLLINDIALAAVTDEYLAKVEGLGELPLEEASEFVSLAATLLLIKSRSLLPSLTLTEEETQDIKELEYRLALYQIIRDTAAVVGRGLRAAVLWEGVVPAPMPVFAPDSRTTIPVLADTARRLVEEFPKPAAVQPKVAVKKAVSLEEMIEKLAARISGAMQVSFREFTGHARASGTMDREQYEHRKREVVVGFLALLELVKRGIIRATQSEHFADITLEQDAVSTPSYL